MEEFKLIWGLIERPTRRKLLVLQIVNVFAGLLQLAGVGAIVPLMAIITNPDSVQDSRYLRYGFEVLQFTDEREFLAFIGGVMLFCLATSNLTTSVTSYFENVLINRIRHRFSTRLFEAYLRQPYGWFLDKNSSEILRNVFGVSQSVVTGFLQPLSNCLAVSVRALLLIALVFAIDPVVASLATILLSAVYGAIYVFLRRRLMNYGKAKLGISREINLSVTEAVGGIKELRVLDKEGFFRDRFDKVSDHLAGITSKEKWLSTVPKKLMETLVFAGIIGLVVYSVGDESRAEEMLPLLSLYAVSSLRILPALQSVYATASAFRANVPAARLLHQHLVEAESGMEEIPPEKTVNICRQIELTDVSFSYPSRPITVLQNVSLAIPINQSVAFAGATGSGKTTLVDIILGLYQPTSGSLKIDGQDLLPSHSRGWQQNLGYVPQNIFLIDSSIRANIALGYRDEAIDQSRVEEVAKLAQLHDFVMGLPDNYRTVVGERGVQMSGGQRQRLGLARALYRDPKILILDEATSALDGLTEKAIMDAIDSLKGKKTLIIIAHRLSTLKNCDTIFLLDKGRLRDFGTYDELSVRSNLFQTGASRESVAQGEEEPAMKTSGTEG